MRSTVVSILGFTFGVIWTFGFLLGALAIYPLFSDGIIVYWTGINRGLTSFLLAWYMFTVVAIGSYTAYRSFRFIGKWTKVGTK